MAEIEAKIAIFSLLSAYLAYHCRYRRMCMGSLSILALL
jgi:hypothetical protein